VLQLGFGCVCVALSSRVEPRTPGHTPSPPFQKAAHQHRLPPGTASRSAGAGGAGEEVPQLAARRCGCGCGLRRACNFFFNYLQSLRDRDEAVV
jgi:hypothetical protein